LLQPSDGSAISIFLRRAFSFPVLLGTWLGTAAFVAARLHLPDPDTWWHLAVGEEILSTGTWPTADHYSFTVSGHPWMAYEWLGEVAMALAARLGGLPALAALLIGLSVLVMLLLYYYAYLRSGNFKAALISCATVLPLSSFIFTLRPQLFGYIFLITTLICLEAFRRGRAWTLWVLPLVFLLWVNTHGTFVFGLFVMGVHWASGLVELRRGGLVAERWTAAQRRQWAVVLLLCVLALALTPYGTRVAASPLEIAFLQPTNVANISEWQPMPFDSFLGKLFLVLLLGFVVLQMLFPLTYRLEEIGLLLFAIYAAATHQRFALFFAIVFAPLLAARLSQWVPGYQPAKDKPALNAVLIALTVAVMLVVNSSDQPLAEQVAESFPKGAVDYLQEQEPTGPTLNEYAWGGYLIWAAGREQKVFIDGRLDLYEYAGVFSDYLDMTRLAPNALFLLQKYRIEACLLNRDAPLGTLLTTLPEWEQVYADELSVLFLHRASKSSSSSGTG
jgi:hypothetical protein